MLHNTPLSQSYSQQFVPPLPLDPTQHTLGILVCSLLSVSLLLFFFAVFTVY